MDNTTDRTPSERLDINGEQYVRSDIHADTCAEQYKVGLDHGLNIGKNKARTAIIETLRDTVGLQGADIDEAQNLLDALLNACEMDAGTLLTKWTVYATLDDSDFHEWENIEASTEEEAIDEVRDSLSISEVTLSVLFSTSQGYANVDIRGYDFPVEHALDWSATEENY
jgi:hypothetical protein